MTSDQIEEHAIRALAGIPPDTTSRAILQLHFLVSDLDAKCREYREPKLRGRPMETHGRGQRVFLLMARHQSRPVQQLWNDADVLREMDDDAGLLALPRRCNGSDPYSDLIEVLQGR